MFIYYRHLAARSCASRTKCSWSSLLVRAIICRPFSLLSCSASILTLIIHAAVLSKFMNDPLSSGMILMLTTQEPDLAASRGQGISQVIERIANIFGGDSMRMKLDGIVFCLTKPVQLTKSSYGKHIHSALTKKWEQVGSEFNNVVFDPFNKVKHKMTQKEMLDIFGRDNTHTGQV